MRILFVTANLFWPQVVGGVETSTIDLGEALGSRGHSMAVICSLAGRDMIWLRNRFRRTVTGFQFPHDSCRGLHVYRGWNVAEGLPEVVGRFDPDVLVLSGLADRLAAVGNAALRTGRPVFYYVHDLGLVRNMRRPHEFTPTGWIANSAYTQRVLSKDLGIASSIVPPAIRRDRYEVPGTGRSVTMINPSVGKGGDVAVSLAQRFPTLPFLFVEGWFRNDRHVRLLREKAARMPNVTWTQSTSDMRTIYSRTRIVLAPSKYEETWGRTVTEAQFSGIPAITSDSGALPETVGAGGVIVPASADAEQWGHALGRLLDQAEYARVSEAARLHSARPDIRPDVVANRFLQVLSGSGA